MLCTYVLQMKKQNCYCKNQFRFELLFDALKYILKNLISLHTVYSRINYAININFDPSIPNVPSRAKR